MSRQGPQFEAAVRERLDDYLDAQDLAAVWFARPASFAWVTGGTNVVDRASERGEAAVGYDGTNLTVVTNNIEGDRLGTEELPKEATVETCPWHRDTLADAVADESPRPAAADLPIAGFADVRADISDLRQPLTDTQVAQYRRLGATVATTVESVCRELSPSTTEQAAAGRLRGRLAEKNVDTPVALVGGERRAQAFRHYVPSDEELGAYALVSVTAERWGLHASCTRTVAFDPPTWLEGRHESAARVEAAALAATRRVGRRRGTAGDVFAAIRDAYDAVGYSEQWHNHHQGGAAGYASREWIATPDSETPVSLPMAYAWNPTIAGAKSEDTHLVTDDGFEALTMTGDWPTIDVRVEDHSTTVSRPAVLVR